MIYYRKIVRVAQVPNWTLYDGGSRTRNKDILPKKEKTRCGLIKETHPQDRFKARELSLNNQGGTTSIDT